MKITKYIHSCLIVEEGDTRILFDPGNISFIEGRVRPTDLIGVSGIFITHMHPDHIDEEAFEKVIRVNPEAPIFASFDICSAFASKGIYATIFEQGDVTIGSLNVRAVSATHDPVLGSAVPRNVAFVINRKLLIPGDSFNPILYRLKNIPALALPIMAPWANEMQVAEFARQISPKHIIPIHDGFAKDFFLQSRYDNFEKHFAAQNIKFHRVPNPADSVTI